MGWYWGAIGELYEKFSKMTQRFVIYGIKDVPERMN